MRLLDGVKGDASYSPCRTYRYALTREWFDGRPMRHVLWVMLNPSTAEADVDDPTVRRCQTFARAWGYNGATIANIFALRSTDPAVLVPHPDPVGPANDDVIEALATGAGIGLVMAAWGSHGAIRNRGAVVTQLVTGKLGRDMWCLGTTKGGQPRHPLYVHSDTESVLYRSAA